MLTTISGARVGLPFDIGMPSSQGTSSERSRDERITLPPIREILREELTSSTETSLRTLGHSFSTPLFSALSESSPRVSTSSRLPPMSPDLDYNHRSPAHERDWGDLPSPRRAANVLSPSPSSSSRSHGAHSPNFSARRSGPEDLSLRRSSAATSMSHRHGQTGADIYPPHSRIMGCAYNHSDSLGRAHEPGATLMSNVEWERHRHRNSSESAWSSHSSTSGTSAHIRARPPSNALQFQPLPHTQMTSHASRPPSNLAGVAHSSVSFTSDEYQSPFGVLIADGGPFGVSPSDPQRMAILRTLRASGQQGSFPLNFDDSRHPSQSARYECQYCGKRFTRPSSLKIHIHSHTGEKPFECTYEGCSRRFSVQSNMRRHARVHESGAQVGESSGDEHEGETASS